MTLAALEVQVSLKDRAEAIWELAVAYSSLVECEAPDDIQRGVAYWLRTATQTGFTSGDLDHVLASVHAIPIGKK